MAKVKYLKNVYVEPLKTLMLQIQIVNNLCSIRLNIEKWVLIHISFINEHYGNICNLYWKIHEKEAVSSEK